MFSFGRSVKAKQCNGIIISGDHNQNISIHYGPTEASLSIPFKPDSLTDSIDSLLIWQGRLTPLIGRNETVDELMQWAQTGPRISLKLIHGAGGVGKTRLAFEVASKLRDQKWEAGQLASLDNGSTFRLGTSGTLLIIDYPEQQPERVQRLLQAIKEAEEPATPLRILLLSRRSQLLDQLGESLSFLATKPLALIALDNTEATWSLLESAWPRLCELRKKGNIPLPVKREVVRLEKEGEAKKLHKLALPLLKGLAAVSGGITAQQLKALANCDSLTELLPDYERLRDCSIWQEKKEESAGQVVALQPDLLAAALLSQLLWRDDEQPGEWLYAVLDVSHEIESATSRLGRLMHDATEVLGFSWPQADLIEAVKSDLQRCRRLDEGLSRSYLERPLLPLTLHVGQVLADATEEPAEQARLLNNLSVRLVDSGDRAGGLAAIRRAVEIREKLSSENFAAYSPDLARSLNNLSVYLSNSGDRTGGLAAIRRAVDIYEKLSPDNFSAYDPNLAVSYSTLSNSLADSGDRVGGLKAVRQSVDIYERLSVDNFAVYGPDLAMSLNNLSICLAENGDSISGLEVIWRSVDIREKLSVDNFAVYGPDLAMSLNTLSIRLAGIGDRAGGLEVIRRSVDIRENLSSENFAVYGPDLASSLNNLSVRLTDSGDRAGGLEAIRRSVDIYKKLPSESFAAYGLDLANSLNTLSNFYADDDNYNDAISTVQRAIELTSPEAIDGTTYGDRLEKMKNNLARYQTNLSDGK